MHFKILNKQLNIYHQPLLILVLKTCWMLVWQILISAYRLLGCQGLKNVPHIANILGICLYWVCYNFPGCHQKIRPLHLTHHTHTFVSGLRVWVGMGPSEWQRTLAATQVFFQFPSVLHVQNTVSKKEYFNQCICLPNARIWDRCKLIQ